MTDRPNILFVLVDDQRFDTIRALGNSDIWTPNLDALVARGTVFSHAHIPGGTSPAVCMPSRAMLMTGRTLFHIEGEGQNIPPAHTTLGECFQQAGYTTFATGKWHNGGPSFGRSFGQADEVFFGGMADPWNVPVYHYDPSGQYAPKTPFIRDPFYSNKLELGAWDHIATGIHATDLFSDTAAGFLRSSDLRQPFFGYVALMSPHDPRSMPEKFRRMYNPENMPLPANFKPAHEIDTGALDIRDELLAAFPRQPQEIQRHIAEYYAMISHLDDGLGRLMNALSDRRLLDNTIVVFSADHGLAVGQHGLMGKQNVYEHSVRIPLIFSGPGIPAGAQRSALVYLLDVFPTLCDLAGVAIPASVEGDSLVPCIQDAARPGREWLYLAYGSTIRGVSNGTYKLIEYSTGSLGRSQQGATAAQLFDLQADPAELHNLIDAPHRQGLAAQMRAHLLRLRDQWDDCQHPTGKTFWGPCGSA